MKLVLYLVALVFLTTTDSSVYNNIKEDVLSFLKRSYDDRVRFEIQTNNKRQNEIEELKEQPKLYQKAMKLKKKSLAEYKAQQKSKQNFEDEVKFKEEQDARLSNTKTIGSENYELDPVLNFLRRGGFRRKRGSSSSSSSSETSSSSRELQDWKDEWKEHWIQKKFEAINSSEPRGDVVNMVAARPWGVPCGDPNQHDMPWGSCMLPMECESEYRIYRGDYFCGRTQFVCCALQLTNYDMYQGFDVSFEDSALTTDSEEKKNRGKSSKEKKTRKKRRERKRRQRERKKRKEKIKKNIRKIIKEIRRILNRAYRNGTTSRKKKTKQLKKYIKALKKKYKQDRQSVKDIHEDELIKIDAVLQQKLNQIKGVNNNFMKNETFRDIVINGTTNKQGARMLMEAYPDLAVHLADKTRRDGRKRSNYRRSKSDNLEYDIEYGLLYY